MANAGWYDDPTHRFIKRYFDGNGWTERVIDTDEREGTDSIPIGTSPAGKPQVKPIYKQWWFWVAMGVVAIPFVCGFYACARFLSPPDTSSQSAQATTEQAAPDTQYQVDPTPPVETSPQTTDPNALGIPAPAPEPQKEIVKTTAKEILKEFNDNEVAADAKYKGKRVEVTGIIDRVESGWFGVNTLRLDAGETFEFTTVDCTGISDDVLVKLKAGSRVTVIGDFLSGNDLGVNLYDCSMK